MKENSLLTCLRYVSVFKESICISKSLYNVVWESTVCNWWPAPKMLETSEGYVRWEWSWRGCCPCTGYHGRFGSTTNFSVSVTELSVVSVRNTHSWKHRRVKPSKYRYIRQGITLIGPHCEAFTNGLGTIIEVQALFSRRFKEGQLDNWAPSFIRDEPGISASTRYFQHVSDTLPDDIMPLDDKVDTHHMLAAASEDGFVHTRDNHVEYYERDKDDKGTYRYVFNILHHSLLDTETHMIVTSMPTQRCSTLEILLKLRSHLLYSRERMGKGIWGWYWGPLPF